MVLLLFALALPPTAAETKPRASGDGRVVLIVWDGMRPDFVSPSHTPALWKLAQGGVTFRNHHSIYPSLTNVNAAALATGIYPSRNGIVANWVFRPDRRESKVATESWDGVGQPDKNSGSKYIKVTTIAGMVQARGGRTAVAGTKTASLLHDRLQSRARAATGSVSLFAGKTLPTSALIGITGSLGSFPERAMPNVAQDAWTTRALTEVLWKEGVPEFSVLWMSEPDRSQHVTAPGSAASVRAIESVDANLTLVLRALEEKEALETTDIFVVSDHGFSTIRETLEIGSQLRGAGLKTADEKALTLSRGEVKVIPNGGSNLFYVGKRDRLTIRKLVTILQQASSGGVVFSREPVEGTFPLGKVQLDVAGGPDVVMASRWDDQLNDAGAAGRTNASRTGEKYLATHGTLSRFDMHNTLIAAGPHFRREITSQRRTSMSQRRSCTSSGCDRQSRSTGGSCLKG